MKLIKRSIFFILISVALLFTLYTVASVKVNSLKLEEKEAAIKSVSEVKTSISSEVESKLENENEVEKKHKKKKAKVLSETIVKERTQNSLAQAPPTVNSTNVNKPNLDKLSLSTWRDLNASFVKQDIGEYYHNNRKWDFNIMDKQLEDIAQQMNYKQERVHTPTGMRSFLQQFILTFEACDTNGDNVLNYPEFTTCMANDTYLSRMSPPTPQFASYVNYTFTNDTGFNRHLFNIIDQSNNNFATFADYMLLRLWVWSWKHCSVLAPFIEEINFECALEVSSGFKTLSRTTVRRLFLLGLELANASSARTMDFVTFCIIANSVRLYAKINGKEDSDLTRDEFGAALDRNFLPMRYSQDTIDVMFRLVEEHDRPSQGIDVFSFIFYDFFLRLFNSPGDGTFGYVKQRQGYMSPTEFTSTLSHFLFPNSTLQEIMKIPQNNITANAYQMYTYLNITNYHDESDHFLRTFLETEAAVEFDPRKQLGVVNNGIRKSYRFMQKSNVNDKSNNNDKTKGNIFVLTTNTTLAFNQAATAIRLFKIIDADSDGWLDFYDFGTFMQVSYIYSKIDKMNAGRIPAGQLFESLSSYSDFPVAAFTIRDRAQRFNLLPKDVNVDLLDTHLMMRIDDIVKGSVRKSDINTMFEYELKSVFSQIGWAATPDLILNKCLRGTDYKNVPLYDWECAFVENLNSVLKYYENSYAYLMMKAHNLTLLNTVFVNPDPSIPAPQAPK